MNKHTQGPWMWVKKDDYWNLETADGEMIADDGSSCGEYGGWFGSEWPNANARLIAAAPDLYLFVASKAESGDNEALELLERIHGNAKRD